MSYTDLLHQYGSRQDSVEIRRYIYVDDPRKLSTVKDVAYRDKRTAEEIAQLQQLIDDLKDYRAALAARYGQLETMAYKRLLKIQRETHWKGPITYTVTIKKIREDGTKEEELRETFQGIDRHKAIARYHELQKQYPGIPCEMDIKKGSWER